MMKINNSSDFGKAIREKRKSLGYTQQDLSAFTGRSVSFLSDLERGKKTTELDKALCLAATLGLDVIIAPRGTGE